MLRVRQAYANENKWAGHSAHLHSMCAESCIEGKIWFGTVVYSWYLACFSHACALSLIFIGILWLFHMYDSGV
jgi:hypothetical protein